MQAHVHIRDRQARVRLTCAHTRPTAGVPRKHTGTSMRWEMTSLILCLGFGNTCLRSHGLLSVGIYYVMHAQQKCNYIHTRKQLSRPKLLSPKRAHPSPFAIPADSGVPAVGILSANAFPDLSRGKWSRKSTGLLPRAFEGVRRGGKERQQVRCGMLSLCSRQ